MINHKHSTPCKITNIPYPEHGGNPAALSQLSGIDPDALIDFSASINPLSPPSCISQLLLETPRLLQEYPDPNCTLITERISQSTEIPTDWVRVGNGSTEIIYLLPHLIHKGQEVVILDPCFSEYEKAFTAFGFCTHSITLNADNSFKADSSVLFPKLDAVEKLGAIVLGNPASPTGKLYADFLPQIQNYCDARNIILIIDEAFIDFSSATHSAWNLLQRNTNLILIRSLTKFYSIPGLRIGYGVLHPSKIHRIAPYQYPWSVNALAQAVGAEILLDTSFQIKTCEVIARERQFMIQALKSIQGIEVFQSDTNFLLFRIRENGTAQGLYQYLLSQSLLIRNCGNFKGLNESFFRISVREHQENVKLVSSISEYFSDCTHK